LVNKYQENRVLPKFNALTFDNQMSGGGNDYVLTIIKGLEHKYPNEINNPNEVVAADLL
jgi:hypothetical protein